jgi:uncharacterized membrane protein YkvI
MKNSWFQRFILPGFIFQSAIIAGAYGSGRELAQFFLGHGPLGGLLGMAVTTVIFSIVLASAFEFSRYFQLFDYRSFFQKLLGRAWPLYEILYVLQMIIVISVVGAVAGDIVRDTFGLPTIVGIVVVMTMIALLVFYGTLAVERFFAVWSFVLFGTYIAFMTWNLVQHGAQISANLESMPVGEGWARSGLAYSGYNMSIIPALLFCVRHLQKRSDAITAGVLGGPIAMLPAALFFVAMIGQYDTIVAEGGDGALPITVLLNALAGAEFFVYLFPIVLFGTFIETGAALIHGLNERLDHTFRERGKRMPNWMRSVIAITTLITAVVVADAIGLTDLIAKGYGTMTWGFLLVFVLPLVTYGMWLLWSRPESPATVEDTQ